MKDDNGKEYPGGAAGRPYIRTRLSELLGTGAKWANPSKWLEKALRAAGRAPAEAAAMMAQLTEVFGTEPAVKLAAYDEAKRLYTQMVRDGRKDLEVDLAMLCETKAALQFAMGDVAGADQERDQVVAIVERLAEQEGRLELSSNLANAYASKSIAVRDLGDSRGCGGTLLPHDFPVGAAGRPGRRR